MNDELFRRMVKRFIDDANSVLEREREDPTDEFIQGEKVTYYCILDTIKNWLFMEELDVSDYGLDIDLDALYM